MRIIPHPPRTLVLLAVLVALVSIAAPAQADTAEKIIDRCTHGESLSGFSQKAYREALKDISAGTEEYSNCAQLIRQAQLAAAGAGHGGVSGAGAGTPTSGAAVTPTPAEQQAISRAPNAGSAPLRVGAQTIRPGVVPVNIDSALNSLPTPLLATIAFLLLCLLLAASAGVRNRIRARRGR
jgi:hypothetical protein